MLEVILQGMTPNNEEAEKQDNYQEGEAKTYPFGEP